MEQKREVTYSSAKKSTSVTAGDSAANNSTSQPLPPTFPAPPNQNAPKPNPPTKRSPPLPSSFCSHALAAKKKHKTPPLQSFPPGPRFPHHSFCSSLHAIKQNSKNNARLSDRLPLGRNTQKPTNTPTTKAHPNRPPWLKYPPTSRPPHQPSSHGKVDQLALRLERNARSRVK